MKKTLLIPTLLIIICASGCATGNKFRKQHNPASIPADLRSNGHVLLVSRYEGGMMGNRNNRAMKKFLSKHYGAPFELVSDEEMKSSKYSDVNKYRYYITGNTGNQLNVTEISRTMSTSRSYTDQVIIDRKENKPLPPTNVLAPSFAAGIKMFAEYLGKN